MLHIQNIHYEIGERVLLDSINWVIEPGKRAALIGPNGAGKSTLLNIINGSLQPNAGDILKPKDYKIGYLPQETIQLDNEPILKLTLRGRQSMLDLSARIKELHQQLEENGDSSAAQLEQLGSLEHQFQTLGGYNMEADAAAILAGLGFAAADLNRKLAEFSGGWRMRVYLAQLLFQQPDLLLLDEPTNHLDLPSLEWLESYLSSFRGSIVIVSHDRFFIDRLAEEIVELNQGQMQHYAGNYHFYEKERARRIEQAIKQNEQLETERKRQTEFIERFRYKATKAAQVQSRVKALERMEGPAQILSDTPTYSFEINVDTPSYHDVLHMQNAAFRYEQDWVLHDINLDVYRNQKMALVGVNGAGKTTLTRLIVGQLQPEQGSIELGKRVSVGYYAQHQVDTLNLDATAFDEVAATVTDRQYPKIRDILGMFGFHGDDVYKPIRVLSGGEKARVSLAKILLSPVNFLIMDEPTNHLDIKSKEALEKALVHYDGTLLLISHDRYFLDKIVQRVIELKEHQLREYEGNYSDYLARRQAEKELNLAAASSGQKESGKKSQKEEKRRRAEARNAISKERRQLEQTIADCEKAIESHEARLQNIETLLAMPETYGDPQKAAELNKEYRATKSELERLMQSWETSHDALEELLNNLDTS